MGRANIFSTSSDQPFSVILCPVTTLTSVTSGADALKDGLSGTIGQRGLRVSAGYTGHQQQERASR